MIALVFGHGLQSVSRRKLLESLDFSGGIIYRATERRL
jgi:hypothetical protein